MIVLAFTMATAKQSPALKFFVPLTEFCLQKKFKYPYKYNDCKSCCPHIVNDGTSCVLAYGYKAHALNT